MLGPFNGALVADESFRNPYAVAAMSSAFGLSSFPLYEDEPTLDLALVQRLREGQNKQWAADLYALVAYADPPLISFLVLRRA